MTKQEIKDLVDMCDGLDLEYEDLGLGCILNDGKGNVYHILYPYPEGFDPKTDMDFPVGYDWYNPIIRTL